MQPKFLHRIVLGLDEKGELHFTVKSFPVQRVTPKFIVANEIDPKDGLAFREHKVQKAKLNSINENVEFASLDFIRYRCYTVDENRIDEMKRAMSTCLGTMLYRRQESLNEIQESLDKLNQGFNK